jgi:hypothetical protein
MSLTSNAKKKICKKLVSAHDIMRKIESELLHAHADSMLLKDTLNMEINSLYATAKNLREVMEELFNTLTAEIQQDEELKDVPTE